MPVVLKMKSASTLASSKDTRVDQKWLLRTNPHSALDVAESRERTWRMPTAAVMPSGTIPKQNPRPCWRCWCDHMTNPANFASVGGGGAMYAVTEGSENSVKSV